jgi:hypothetical protein
MATTDLDADTKREVRAEFGGAVNMTAGQLRKWLEVHRHQAHRPKGDVSDTTWRYSLRNWGPNPLR